MMLVTLQQASDHLRRDTTDDDADLTLKIKAASRLVMNYLGVGAASFTDSAGDIFVDSHGDAIGIPEDVQIATLMMTGYLFRERDCDDEKAFEQGFLPKAVTALLFPIKAQVFA